MNSVTTAAAAAAGPPPPEVLRFLPQGKADEEVVMKSHLPR
jgi:hypothetical protein